MSDHVTCSQLLLLFTAKTSDDYTLKETFTFNEMPFFNGFFFCLADLKALVVLDYS